MLGTSGAATGAGAAGAAPPPGMVSFWPG
ncbi:hypothetical protein AB6813_04190 [bacterium RCC_150]